jgi:hypothetical protein
MAIVELHDRVVRDALAHTFGREVKHLGDGMMGVFVAATDAIRCASAVHAALRDASDRVVEPVRVRVGAATGEPLERNGDFFGSTVQMASRLCAVAEPGQTLVSSSVVEACEGQRFLDVGERMLKGFSQPIRAHAVVDATELLVRLFLAARRRPAVLLTDRSPLDGLVKHASFAGPGTVAGRLYRLAARRYRRIALLDAPAAVLAARDREHDEQTLEQLRQRFREAAAELPNVKLVPSDIGTPELFGLVSDPI